MKTLALVVYALIAAAAPAFAHGGQGGGPVMVPGGGRIAMPISAPDRPWSLLPDRKNHVGSKSFRVASGEPICESDARYRPFQIYQLKGAGPIFVCGQKVVTQNGVLQLPPAFTW